MPDLERLTTEYIPLEDRIRLTGQISEERVVTLWVTQRMLSLLLPHLFEWLQKKTEKSAKAAKSRDKSISNIVQTFAQEAAIAALTNQDQTPVRPAGAHGELLIHSIDITSGDLGIRIGFKAESTHEDFRLINLTMEHEPLRQWLHILYTQSRQGDWTLRCWPDWMTETEEQTSKVSAH